MQRAAVRGITKSRTRLSSRTDAVPELKELFYFYHYYYFFSSLAALVFVAANGLSVVVASEGNSPGAVHGLLTAVASLVAEHRLQAGRLQ